MKSAFLLAKEVYPHLRKQPSGRIVFVSSVVGYNAQVVSRGTSGVGYVPQFMGKYVIHKTTVSRGY